MVPLNFTVLSTRIRMRFCILIPTIALNYQRNRISPCIVGPTVVARVMLNMLCMITVPGAVPIYCMSCDFADPGEILS